MRNQRRRHRRRQQWVKPSFPAPGQRAVSSNVLVRLREPPRPQPPPAPHTRRRAAAAHTRQGRGPGARGLLSESAPRHSNTSNSKGGAGRGRRPPVSHPSPPLRSANSQTASCAASRSWPTLGWRHHGSNAAPAKQGAQKQAGATETLRALALQRPPHHHSLPSQPQQPSRPSGPLKRTAKPGSCPRSCLVRPPPLKSARTGRRRDEVGHVQQPGTPRTSPRPPLPDQAAAAELDRLIRTPP